MFDSSYFTHIVKNSATCLLCGHEIESTHRHDFVVCSCGEISLDGGHSYFRRSARNFSNLKDTSIVRKFTVSELKDELYRINRDRMDCLYSNSFIDNKEKAIRKFLFEWYNVGEMPNYGY